MMDDGHKLRFELKRGIHLNLEIESILRRNYETLVKMTKRLIFIHQIETFRDVFLVNFD